MKSQKNFPGARRKELYSLLGELPPRSRPIRAQLLGCQNKRGYILEKLLLDLNGFEKVPAYFVRPKGRGPFPVVLYNHAHCADYQTGKEELLQGRKNFLHTPSYAEELTRLGYAALAMDCWAFGQRKGRTESAIFKEMLWKGQVMWGMMVYDSLRALDYLVSRRDVDPKRIATLGLSMGSTMAWWVAALDTRIKVCVDICCLSDYQDLIAQGGLDEHGIYYYVPRLLKHFTTAEINALIAPRAHLGLAGNLDPLTPIKGLDRIDAALKVAYRKAGASDSWKLVRSNTKHMETPSMRREILKFLRERL